MLLPLIVLVAAAYGAVAGLFLPRPAYRLAVEPEETWRAECPGGHPLPGWLGRSRCEGCAGQAYGPGAAGLAVLTAVICAALAGAVGARPELAVWLLLVPGLMLLATVDWRVHRLPDVLTLPLAGGAVALLGAASPLPGAGGSWTGALLGGAVLSGVYFVLFLINPRGMGFGDVKLAITLGVALGWYGWDVLFAGAFAGFLLGAVYGLSLVLAGRAGRRTAMPFGPFMVVGALAGVLLGGLSV
ncbi:prepilin peptidase [Streptomyces gobiensis]|uniref:prepilin peptidase n=1 Tax=Streptomyces gobiensis TaxID=2875706 RepID=UPI001E50511A|nr:A24 family peptidase [Streptomyces gobiensis]UGY93401.1 A24 family peptidase [Streptomyces gobiensis]